MHRISSQLQERLEESYTKTELHAMLHWFEISGREASVCPQRGDAINAKLVDEWISFKNRIKAKTRHKASLLKRITNVCVKEEKTLIFSKIHTFELTHLAALSVSFNCYGDVVNI